MDLQEITVTTTEKQVKLLEALAKVSQVSVEQALRAAVYLGLGEALDMETRRDNILTVHEIDTILAVQQAGAVDTADDKAIDALTAKHEEIIESLRDTKL